MIRVDNGPEFTSALFEVWTQNHKIKPCFIQLGKPPRIRLWNALMEATEKEPLNAHLFTDLEQVRDQTQQWIWAYNNIRPHESLGNKPPVTFLKQRGVTVPSLNVDMHLKEKTICTNASV